MARIYPRQGDRQDLSELFCDHSFRVIKLCRRILRNQVRRSSKSLERILQLALSDDDPSEYSFIFRVAFSHRASDFAQIEESAACIHLLQESTFVIDDILDRSDTRHHRKTLQARFGVDRAIIAGHILHTLAFERMVSEMHAHRLQNVSKTAVLLSKTIRDVYIGQFFDVQFSGNANVSLSQYRRLIALTTGRFVAAAGRAGAWLANRKASDCDLFSQFGYYYGMALQISDDVLDICCSSQETGQTFAKDLICGRARLPYLLGISRANPRDRRFLRDSWTLRESQGVDIERIIRVLTSCGAIDVAKESARRYIRKAVSVAMRLTDSRCACPLIWLAECLAKDQGVD